MTAIEGGAVGDVGAGAAAAAVVAAAARAPGFAGGDADLAAVGNAAGSHAGGAMPPLPLFRESPLDSEGIAGGADECRVGLDDGDGGV